MPEFHGGCHCGALKVTFTSKRAATDLEVRECGCGFCRTHGARTMTDPEGAARIAAAPDALNRYRFGLKTADFLVCRTCGAYLGAYFEDAGQGYATLNVNTFVDRTDFSANAKHADYAAEDTAGRLARRKARWTPATLTEGAAP